MEKQMTCTKRKVCISLKVCTGNTFPTRLEVKAWKFFFISVDLVDSGVKEKAISFCNRKVHFKESALSFSNT